MLNLVLLAQLIGCQGQDATQSVATVSPAVPTVINVRWRSDQPTFAWVEYGPTDALGHTTPVSSEAVQEHAVSLMGLPAHSDVYYRVVEQGGGGLRASAIEVIESGGLSADVPTAGEIVGTPLDGWLLTPVVGGAFGPMMFDADGEVVWFLSEAAGLKSLRAVVSVDGKGIVHNAIDANDGAQSELIWSAFDGATIRRVTVPGMTHDFVELPDGAVGTFIIDKRVVDGVEYAGSTLVEVGLDDSITEVWSTWDDLDPVATGGDVDPGDWAHANAIDYDPYRDGYLVGSRNFSTIFHIDRGSGAMDWALGDIGATLTVDDSADRFLRQHQFQQIDAKTMLVFDNEGGVDRASRIGMYRMDCDGGTAERVGGIDFAPERNIALGDVWRNDAGVTTVIISLLGEVLRVDAEGRTLGQLFMPLGYGLGYGQPLSTPYGPELD